MATIEVKKLFNNMKEHRRQLHSKLASKAARQQQHRSKNLLTYLAEHEQRNQAALEQIIDDVQPSIERHWVNYYPRDQEHDLNLLLAEDWEDFDDVIENTIAAKESMAHIYQYCAEGFGHPDMKDAFQRMKEREESQLKNLGRRLNEIDQGY
ncbi:ferritin family protein [Pseudobacteriovorax antillogorgiicola]|uniref:Rubrerythrin n=1 Tax=Pseudobacteriovorax antillogorgiicola TaxID=1513793 RepID=A0A1Y6CGE8_9BACT|nr:ferritin family protein [Pseudobacteriovorax antillogorgiicola]TCS47564.1 rubrerythrin [Pseudobacteriovorax antillogorgiicola]SMF60513.1 Rubrerythrin [Pseudobacteriovorax antillogorgiicola]